MNYRIERNEMNTADAPTTTDDPRPDRITVEQIATDLSLSNEEATSWFWYGYDKDTDTILVELYGDEGQIVKLESCFRERLLPCLCATFEL